MALNFDKETFSDNDNITNSFLEIQTPEDLAAHIEENVKVLKNMPTQEIGFFTLF